MNEMKLGPVEAQFADIIWAKAPLTTKELVALCEKSLNWKRTTTYTVLKKLCDRGLFAVTDRIVTAKISRETFYGIQCEHFVEDTFCGSLPAFIVAFTARKPLTATELAEIKTLLRSLEEESV